MFFAFLFLGLSLTNAAIANCATVAKPSLFTIDTLSQDPADTITAGQNMTLNLIYTSPSTVSAGTATTSITYNFLPLSPTVADLCTSIICPLAPGQHDGSSTYPFPTGISGTLVTQIVWADENGMQLLCIKSTVKVVR
jgi:hypothetical protein